MIFPVGHARLYIGTANPKLEESVSSPMTECITGVFPEKRPAIARNVTIAGRLVLNPNANVAIAHPKFPQSMTGRRPILSEGEDI